MITIATSNTNKKNEIKEVFDFDFIDAPDIEEVDCQDPINVIKYKAVDMYRIFNKDGIVVEDTILEINGKTITDIKFRLKEIEDSIDDFIAQEVKITTSVGTVVDNKVIIFKATLSGVIGYKEYDGFGFDPYFYLKLKDGHKSLAELKINGLKNNYSPRIKVLEKLNDWIKGNLKPDYSFDLLLIPCWKGSYQK